MANYAPSVLADTETLDEDATPNTVSGYVLRNDFDADGDTVVVDNWGTIALTYGSLELHLDGSYTYTLNNSNPSVDALNNGQHLTDTFTYIASDGVGGTTASTLTITINGSTDNDAPAVTADTNSILEDSSPNTVSGNVLSNDSDPDGDTLSVANAGTITLTYGLLVIRADGSYTYTLDNANAAVNALNGGQHVTDTFTYTASDGHGGTTATTLTITINGSTDNRRPVVNADTNTVTEDSAPNPVSGNVLINDSDLDGHTLSVANAGTITLSYGLLVIRADGSYTYTLDNSNAAVNALNNGQHLTDTFTYTASDGHGGTTSSTLTITINGSTDGAVNGNPVASGDANSITEGATPDAVTGNVLTNDSDPDGDTLSVTSVGTFTLTYGSLVINANGSYTYTLNNSNADVDALASGQHLTDTFDYDISDGYGGTDSERLTITINGTTDYQGPAASADVNSITEGKTPDSVTGNVLSNDSNPQGGTLSVINAGTITLKYGALVIGGDGSYSYTLDNANPAVTALTSGQTLTDIFTYTLSDGYGGSSSASLSITINGSNLAPVNTMPSSQSALRNNVLVFSAADGNQIAIDNPDAGESTMEVTLAASKGLMTLSQSTGLTFTQGDGTDDATLTFSGSIADINSALEGMRFLSSKAGTASITMTTRDLDHSGEGEAPADTDVVTVKVETNATKGGNGADDLKGTSGTDEVLGRGGKDTLSGLGGDDILDGGEGQDQLRGDAGADSLTGGAGADVFLYRKATDSTLTSMDVITDFDPSTGDRIDLSAVDANGSQPGNPAFTFIGTGNFSGRAGELRFERSGGATHVYGDTDGDGIADLAILLASDVKLRAGHFEL